MLVSVATRLEVAATTGMGRTGALLVSAAVSEENALISALGLTDAFVAFTDSDEVAGMTTEMVISGAIGARRRRSVIGYVLMM